MGEHKTGSLLGTEIAELDPNKYPLFPPGPAPMLTLETATAIVRGGGAKYRRVDRTVMVQMNQDFAVDTGHGVATGKAGDYLALDSAGMPYPIEAAVVAKSYVKVERKTKN